jgi:hydrogenase-4 component E
LPHQTIVGGLINSLATLFLLCAFALIVARQMLSCIYAYATQSLLLAIVALTLAIASEAPHLFVLAGLALFVKALFIPWLLKRTIHGSVHEKRELDFYFDMPASLIISGILVIVAYAGTTHVLAAAAGSSGQALSIGVATILIGLWTMISRREAVPQVVGLLSAENGLMLSALATVPGLPLIAEIGILLDLVAAVLILGILVQNMYVAERATDTVKFQRLKG